MKPRLGTLARAGLLALGMSGAAYAGPAGLAPVGVGEQPLAVTPVQWMCDGSAPRGACRNNDTGEVRSRDALRNGSGESGRRYERRDRDEYRSRDRDRDRVEYHRRDRDDDDDWRWRNRERDRRDYYRYRRHNDDRLYLNLGIVPGPRYVEPAPRYRINVTRAHVEWCRDRWRSYRAYDNTYQPTRGPRRQCISPYS